MELHGLGYRLSATLNRIQIHMLQRSNLLPKIATLADDVFASSIPRNNPHYRNIKAISSHLGTNKFLWSQVPPTLHF